MMGNHEVSLGGLGNIGLGDTICSLKVYWLKICIYCYLFLDTFLSNRVRSLNIPSEEIGVQGLVFL